MFLTSDSLSGDSGVPCHHGQGQDLFQYKKRMNLFAPGMVFALQSGLEADSSNLGKCTPAQTHCTWPPTSPKGGTGHMNLSVLGLLNPIFNEIETSSTAFYKEHTEATLQCWHCYDPLCCLHSCRVHNSFVIDRCWLVAMPYLLCVYAHSIRGKRNGQQCLIVECLKVPRWSQCLL